MARTKRWRDVLLSFYGCSSGPNMQMFVANVQQTFSVFSFGFSVKKSFLFLLNIEKKNHINQFQLAVKHYHAENHQNVLFIMQ